MYIVQQATKLNFASHSSAGHLRATGVNVVAVNATGINGTITARKEVLLAAGAHSPNLNHLTKLINPFAGSIQSPQLLELSGESIVSRGIVLSSHI